MLPFCYTPRMIAKINHDRAMRLAREVLTIEAKAVQGVADRIDARFVDAVALLLGCHGRVVVSGIGKSGHIARKIAATLASTGTPAFFVHPAEAVHGDLGMITADDVFIGISYSGETDELLRIMPLVKRMGAKLIALTGHPESSLAALADVHLDGAVGQEACPMNLAPTASTTAALALGDALAIAVLEERGFGPEDFARSHPGGALGRKLLTYVRDIMRTGDHVPRVSAEATVHDALFEITAKRLGMTAVVAPWLADDVNDAEAVNDRNGVGSEMDGVYPMPRERVVGIFTDGDLRRVLERATDLRSLSIRDVMTPAPHSISPDQLAVEAVRQMEQYRVNQMLVVDATGTLMGALNMHDLFGAKVI